MERLDKFLSDFTTLNRNDAKDAIKKGNVTIDGVICKKNDTKIDTDTQKICLCGKEVEVYKHVWYELYKPAGVVTATEDKKQKTVLDLLSVPKKNLFPVGRLDKDTEGLLLITDDGDAAHRLLSPKKHVEKEYFVTVFGEITQETVTSFSEGIELEDFKCLPAKLMFLKSYEKDDAIYSEANVVIFEGKFHQIKRMFKALGLEVTYLKRIRMGNLKLDETLEKGSYKRLTDAEIEELLDGR